MKLKVPDFPSLDKSPQYYLDRYNNEPQYKTWFDSQFPLNTIHDVVGYAATHVADFPSLDKSPQYYLDRYNNEPQYKTWFDSQFPGSSIHNVLGYSDPVPIPDWIRDDAAKWATGAKSTSDFVTDIEFMLDRGIIVVPSISTSVNLSEDKIPSWIRNNAHWWSQDLISEEEFVSSLEFLLKEEIIPIN